MSKPTNNGHDPSDPTKDIEQIVPPPRRAVRSESNGPTNYGQAVPLNWQAGELYLKERRARLIVEGRYLGMRVKCLEKGKLYRVTVPPSKKHPQATEHTVKRNAIGLLCDCTWAKNRPYDNCKHTAVVEDYLDNLPKESEPENDHASD